MPEEGQLIPMNELGLQTADQLGGELDTLTKTSDFLPQVRVYGSETNLVKEGKFPMGHLGLYFTSNNVVDLGTGFDCIVCAARPRASIVTGDQPISFYKFESNEFQDVLARAKAKEAGYLAGLEYLLWIPKVSQYGLFLMGNTTLRRESANVKALLGRGATISIKLIKTAKYTWHGINVFPCTTPMQTPDMELLAEEVEKFKHPVESQVELAEESTSTRAR
jgi:hypothetical protein